MEKLQQVGWHIVSIGKTRAQIQLPRKGLFQWRKWFWQPIRQGLAHWEARQAPSTATQTTDTWRSDSHCGETLHPPVSLTVCWQLSKSIDTTCNQSPSSFHLLYIYTLAAECFTSTWKSVESGLSLVLPHIVWACLQGNFAFFFLIC